MAAAYLEAYRSGILTERARAAFEMMKACRLCPRQCGVDRTAGERGFCRTGSRAVVSSYGPHFGEEDPLVGAHGSGTIFFTHCNLLCLFCQNFDISHGGEGRAVDPEQLADIMLHLQKKGCHNINFVTPSHVVPQILAALVIGVEKGLHIPLVYNTGCYDAVPTLHMLEGVVDIYMPDFKFWDPLFSEQVCGARDYPAVAREAMKEMHRQVGDLTMDEEGVAERGLLLRHLVMPEGRSGTAEIMGFIANEVSVDTYVNIMPQYRPCGRAAEIDGIARRPAPEELELAIQSALDAGIRRLDRRRRTFYVHG